MQDFASRLIAWQKTAGRHGLPWQVKDPYAVWLSEIMLQQTQVETVIPYYRNFLARFPSVDVLAAAEEEDVLALWSGLGYYARARNLHAAARRIMDLHGGRFPREYEAILALPGVGRSTASAIASFAFDERRAILDGNVKRVICRVFGVEGWPGEKPVEDRLWALAESLLPRHEMAAYTQGLMDLGATTCRRGAPDCPRCPFAEDCVAGREGRQSELPQTRPRRTLPEKSVRMLILMHGASVLLEKRPAPVLWGGLWSLPEAELDIAPEAAARQRGYVAASGPAMPTMIHVFTHFRLTIQPSLLHVEGLPGGVEAPGRVWLPVMDALDAALPTPVRRLLTAVVESQKAL